jgi:hypothetical protein
MQSLCLLLFVTKDYFFQIYNKMIKRQLQRPLDKSVIQEDVKDAKDVEDVKLVIEY